MTEHNYFDRNLIALSTRHPELAAVLPGVHANPDLKVIQSRKGSPVPVLNREGHFFPMHSRFDPVSEGKRLAGEAREGYLIAFGLGGAYHLKALLEKKTVTGLMIVEKDLSLLRGLFESIDYTGILSDSRALLLIDPSPEELSRIILDRYLPVLYGDLGSITLRSRWDNDPEWFSSRAAALKGLPEALGRDFTVQTRFGRRWFVHTMLNLARSEEVNAVLPPARRLLITAAGPSLEQQLPEIKKRHSEGATLLATDTSLPLLVSKGITPDIVLSI
ncbi:MAG: motility associated factor glycosyltransferase family protein, partial [Spirochaetaceae bacterium]|nr:motility associated factor glycosyltransferase family protein [Spirochaetaceae bacterium]